MSKITYQQAQPLHKQALESFLVFNNGEHLRPLAQNYISSMFSNDFRKPTFIIAQNSQKDIIGAAAYSEELFTTGTWGISWVSVHENYRNQGIGQKLVETCVSAIHNKAVKPATVILGTYPNKTGLYKKCGFTKLGEDAERGAYMVKHLR